MNNIHCKFAALLIILCLFHKRTLNHGVPFVEIPSTNSSTLNFIDVIKENQKYEPINDYCALRIVGGEKAENSLVPYQVVLRKKHYAGMYWSSFCGGSLVTFKIVLTAAHCIYNTKTNLPTFEMRVVAGTKASRASFITMIFEHWRRVKHFYIDEHYDTNFVGHDLGLIEVENDFVPSISVRPVRLHTPDLKLDIAETSKCLVSGYGLKENDKPSEELRMVCLPILSSFECAYIYGLSFYNSMFWCVGAEGKDSCNGDSGGPLVCFGVQVGIVTGGNECGKYPGIYMRLLPYTDGNYVPFVRRAYSVHPNYIVIFICCLLLIFS